MDLPEDNPYVKKESLEEVPPQQRMLVPPAPPQRPLGPKMSYAERLEVAKQAKSAGPGSAARPAAVAAPAAGVAPGSSPEKLKPTQDEEAAAGVASATPLSAAAAVSATPPTRLLEQEVPEGALLDEDAAQAKVRYTTVHLMWVVGEGTNQALCAAKTPF